jgi:sporulation protein YhbH
MVLNIEQDYLRFRQIVRGKIKQDLKKYISQGELIGKKGKDFVSIPIPQIEMPNFRFGRRNTGGVGQGEGEPGTPLAPGDVDEDGKGQAGNAPGAHILEVDLTLEELAKILAEELELPRIQAKGSARLKTVRDRYSQISKVGPESLRHFKRTYKEALKRQITAGSYDPLNPYIVPIHDDKRYLSWKTKERPESNALIIYMMDVSGSMGDEQKEIVRIESFWIDTWIQTNYNGVVTRYIIHDAVAQEVDRETFFHTRESGGTVISSAYELCHKIIYEEYPQELWNIYVFHFSDGDNWSGGDTDRCISLLKADLLPKVNLFGYGQVESTYGSGQFIRELENNVNNIENLVLSRIENKDDIYQSIKDFLGKGK